MGGGRSDAHEKGANGETRVNHLTRREYFHPRKLAKMAGSEPPNEQMYVVEHHDKFPHTNRVMNEFCTGLALFGMIGVFSVIVYINFIAPRNIEMDEYNHFN